MIKTFSLIFAWFATRRLLYSLEYSYRRKQKAATRAAEDSKEIELAAINDEIQLLSNQIMEIRKEIKRNDKLAHLSWLASGKLNQEDELNRMYYGDQTPK